MEEAATGSRRWTQWVHHPVVRRALSVLLFVVVTLAGAWLGLLVGGRANADVGPLKTSISVDPTVFGHTVVDIAPLGTLEVDSHAGPVGLAINVRAIKEAETRALISDQAQLTSLGADLGDDLRAGVMAAATRGLIAATIGAAIAGAVVYRSTRRAAATAGMAAVVVVGSYGFAFATYDAGAITEPKYSGLLTNAPGLVGDVREIAANVTEYGQQLGRLVQNVSQLYSTTLTLPDYQPSDDTIRVLHVSDLHLNPSAWPIIDAVAKQFDVTAIVDSGDIADHGTTAENAYLTRIASLGVPYVYVRGNHDSTDTESAVKSQPNAVVLDGEPVEVGGLRFVGLPDPRFTPDMTTRDNGDDVAVEKQTEELAMIARTARPRADAVVFHDPTYAELLDGSAPLVLAGHAHKRSTRFMPEGTRLMVQGSTGGAGLRALEGEEPTPVTLTVLYFDRETKELSAWDDITLGGLGLASAEIDRHIAARENHREEPEPADSPSTTPSTTTGQPGTGQPGTGQPGTGQPGTGQPGTGRAGTSPAPLPAAQ